MGGWNSVLRAVGIIVALVILLSVALGPTAVDFRLLVELIFNFTIRIAWPLAIVAIVYILRKPLGDLVQLGAARTQGASSSSKASEQKDAGASG